MKNYITPFSFVKATPSRRLWNHGGMMDIFDQFEKNWIDAGSNKSTTDFINYELNLNSEKQQWDFTLELSGVQKDNLKLDVKEGHLELSGQKTKGLNIGEFTYSFKLPEGIDYNKIEADFSDGVLQLQMPLEEKKLVKRIELK